MGGCLNTFMAMQAATMNVGPTYIAIKELKLLRQSSLATYSGLLLSYHYVVYLVAIAVYIFGHQIVVLDYVCDTSSVDDKLLCFF